MEKPLQFQTWIKQRWEVEPCCSQELFPQENQIFAGGVGGKAGQGKPGTGKELSSLLRNLEMTKRGRKADWKQPWLCLSVPTLLVKASALSPLHPLQPKYWSIFILTLRKLQGRHGVPGPEFCDEQGGGFQQTVAAPEASFPPLFYFFFMCGSGFFFHLWGYQGVHVAAKGVEGWLKGGAVLETLKKN